MITIFLGGLGHKLSIQLSPPPPPLSPPPPTSCTDIPSYCTECEPYIYCLSPSLEDANCNTVPSFCNSCEPYIRCYPSPPPPSHPSPPSKEELVRDLAPMLFTPQFMNELQQVRQQPGMQPTISNEVGNVLRQYASETPDTGERRTFRKTLTNMLTEHKPPNARTILPMDKLGYDNGTMLRTISHMIVYPSQASTELNCTETADIDLSAMGVYVPMEDDASSSSCAVCFNSNGQLHTVEISAHASARFSVKCYSGDAVADPSLKTYAPIYHEPDMEEGAMVNTTCGNAQVPLGSVTLQGSATSPSPPPPSPCAASCDRPNGCPCTSGGECDSEICGGAGCAGHYCGNSSSWVCKNESPPPPPASPPSPRSVVQQDPHIRFADGRLADWRGIPRVPVAFVFSPGFALNVVVDNAIFWLNEKRLRVDGTFIIEHIVRAHARRGGLCCGFPEQNE